jgi:hypothetical protein
MPGSLPETSPAIAELSASGAGNLSSDPVLWAEKLLGFTPDAVQAEILRSEAARLMLCCTRQFGKSTITAIKALHHAWTHPEALVLVAAPTARQSGEWLQKIRGFLSQLGVRGRADGINRLSCKLPNGSRLIGLPDVPDNVRGFSKASLVLIDEAAFVADELYQALNPMLAVSRGSLWLMSTPGAQTGFFYDEWSREATSGDDVASGDDGSSRVGATSRAEASLRTGVSDGEEPVRGVEDSPEFSGSPESWPAGQAAWERYRVTAGQCPRIPAEFLAEQRILLGDAVFRREYLCEFVAAGTQIIDHALLDSALDDDLTPFNGGKALWPK